MAAIQQQIDDAKKEQYEFLHTGKRGKYLGMMMFSTNPVISKPFIDMNFRMYAESKYNKDFEALSEDDIAKAKEDYNDYLQYDANSKLDMVYDVFRNMNEKLSPIFQEAGELGYKQYAQLKRNFYSANLSLTDADGNVTPMTISDILGDMFGSKNATDEDIIEKAESLKKPRINEAKEHPFDEISRFLTYTMPTVDGSAISNGAILIRQLNQAADVFMANGYIDKEVADSMRKLVNQTVTVNTGIYQLDLEDAYDYVSEQAGDAIRSWMAQDLTVANIKEKTQELIETLKSIEGLDETQEKQLDVIIGDIKSQSNQL